MDRKGLIALGAVALLGALVLVLSRAPAQRDFRPEHARPESGVGRYQVVNVSQGEIIILDTVTGDLYTAGPRDLKPHADRPRPEDGRFRLPPETVKLPPQGFKDKDKVGKKDFDKRDFKDKKD